MKTTTTNAHAQEFSPEDLQRHTLERRAGEAAIWGMPIVSFDAPYSLGVFDLTMTGPLVFELPAGPFIGLVDDAHMRWVHDMGRPGSDKGEGGKHLILPPGFTGDVLQGYFVGRAKANKIFVVIRSMPVGGDVAKAIKAFDGIRVYPLKAGDWLDGANAYRLRVPPNPPMKQFWAVSVYDMDTRSLFRNESLNAEVSSTTKGLQKNADGSVDVYFGPEAPKGLESNWVQTVAGKFWFPYFRLYAPTEAYFDKSWPLPDIEKVK